MPTASSLADIASATVWSGTANRPITRAMLTWTPWTGSALRQPKGVSSRSAWAVAELMITPRVSTSSGSSEPVSTASARVAKSRRVATWRCSASREISS